MDVVHNGVFDMHEYSGEVYRSFAECPDVSYPDETSSFRFAADGLRLRVGANGLACFSRAHDLLPIAASMIGGPLRVLDFGGSGGIDFKGLINSTDLDARYTIVETPAICRAGRKLWNDDRIAFCEDLPEGQFDIVYAWGAIHYVPDPIALMKSFAAYRPKAIMILNSPFSEQAFVRVQVNRGKYRMPAWVISMPQTCRVMAECGYRLAFKSTVPGEHTVSNFAPEYRVAEDANLLFVGP